MMWSVKKAGKWQCCNVSGGYVILTAIGKDGLNLESNAHVNVDQYLSDANFQSQVRRALGSKATEEIAKRVAYLVAERQKETPSASAS
eukprot:c38910_g1_i1.p3 GENE.c38910_g1_i1~~c38910_g1_i1.p3  ORF type:complete len:100 (+),score=25.76 c38910_g1_i1:38-301(+)